RCVSELCENHGQTPAIIGRYRQTPTPGCAPIATHSARLRAMVSQFRQHSLPMGVVERDVGGAELWTPSLISETMNRDRHPEAVSQGDRGVARGDPRRSG